MNKKLKNIILIGLILVLSLVILTGCGKKEDTDTSAKQEPEEVVEEFFEAMNDKDGEKLVELFDVKAYATLVSCYSEGEIDDFDENYKEIEKEYNKLSAEEKEEMSSQMANSFEGTEDFEIKVNSVGKCSKVEDVKNLYYADIKYTEDGESKSDIVYLYKVDDKYYFAGLKSLLDTYQMVSSVSENLAEENLKLVIEMLNAENYYNIENVSSIEEYITLEKINDELKENGYMLCEKNDASSEADVKNKKISYGEKLYMSELDDDNIYEFTLEKEGNTINIDDFETVK